MALNTLDHRLIKEEYDSSFISSHREDQHAQFNDIVIEHAIRHDPESNWLHSIIVSERCMYMHFNICSYEIFWN